MAQGGEVSVSVQDELVLEVRSGPVQDTRCG